MKVRNQNPVDIGIFVFFLLALILGMPARIEAQDSDFGTESGPFTAGPTDHITKEERARINDEIERSIRELTLAGKLPRPEGGPVLLQWPTRKASGLTDFNIGQIANYVDQNPAFPGQVLDWNCGTRTYDQADGYNHAGVDINSFAFPWRRMYRNEVEVVAAAAGTIITRDDGNFDQSCTSTNPLNMNRVFIMHSDGSMALYMHLKSGSVTTKQVGDHVEAGEYLGIAGSSGRSTVPHLHLEIHDSNGMLQDPFQGPCNTMNNFSYWAQQEPYRNPRVNTLLTGFAVPQFPACPAEEITNEKVVFQPTEQLTVSAHFRDLLAGQDIQFAIFKPDASVFQQWSTTSPSTANATFRFANWELPADAPAGKWIYQVVFNGVTYTRPFYVDKPPNTTIAGRVSRSNGAAISKAWLVLMDENGTPIKSALTNPFGYYRFSDVGIGQTYNFEVRSKQFVFNRRNLMLVDTINDLNFTAR